MAIDDLLTEFESTLEQESALLELADAWVERTSGEVVPGFVWGRDDYIRNLQQTALWQTGFDVKEVAESIKRVKRSSSRLDEEYFFIYFPKFSFTLDHFLNDSDEIKYTMSSSPRTLCGVLHGYKFNNLTGRGAYVRKWGDCDTIYSHITRKNYSEEFILSSINPKLRKRWEEYQQSRKLRPSVINLVEGTLEHFLNDSDEIKYSPTSEPTSLRNVLICYRFEEIARRGIFLSRGGDCNKIYGHIAGGDYSEDFLLSSINPELRRRWEEYQASRKLPPSVVHLVEKTLGHFLNDSDEIKYSSNSRPKFLRSILQGYLYDEDANVGVFIHGYGKCNAPYYNIKRGNYSEEFLLFQINTDLRIRWDEYQNGAR